MMIRIFSQTTSLLFLLALALQASGQQEQLYTMFMYNKQGLNPAYVGYHDHLCATALYRSQWMGFEGAPETQLVSIQSPVGGERIGLGLNLIRNTIGISTRITADAIYAYKIPLGNGTFTLGAQASLRNHEVDYTDPRLQAVQDLSIDQGVALSRENKLVANFGAGVYYYTDRFYFGLSSPRLMTSDIDFDESLQFVAREVRHIYAMAGYQFSLSYQFDLVPQVLMKYAENAPFDVDMNVMLVWKQDYAFGMTYRTGGATADIAESIDVMASAKILPGLLLGFAYDITLTDISDHANGSIEVALRYCFGAPKRQGQFVNPRYF